MTFLDLARRRHSVRAYRPDPVPDDALAGVLEAARVAPTAATANVVRPGVILTQLGRHQAAKQWMGRLIGWTFMKSVAAGAATQVYVATHPSLAQVNGEFFADCNPEVPGGLMQDDALAAKLWTMSTGLAADWLA